MHEGSDTKAKCHLFTQKSSLSSNQPPLASSHYWVQQSKDNIPSFPKIMAKCGEKAPNENLTPHWDTDKNGGNKRERQPLTWDNDLQF